MSGGAIRGRESGGTMRVREKRGGNEREREEEQ